MREKEASTTIYWVRHGQTDFPLDRIYCDDREDPPLNSAGETQAQRAADLLAKLPVAGILSSPCLRTQQTAEVLAQRLGLPVTLRDELRERHFGIWEGLYFAEIERDYPDDYRRWKQDNAGFKPEGGESIFDLADRLERLRGEILAAYSGKALVIVSHVGPIRAALAQALNLPLPEYRRITVDYASLSRVDYGRRQHNLVFTNLTADRFGGNAVPRWADG